MARYNVTLSYEGSNVKSVAKLAKKFFGEEAEVAVQKAIVPVSRSDRLSAVESSVEDAKSEVETLRDELQEWYDNLPENFQDGEKGSQLQEAIDSLESIISNLEDCDFSVEFPGMFG